MTWSGGTYTKGNSATGGWTGDASLGIGIEAGRHDTQDNDFATGINQCLNKDGSNAATGNLNLGGYKATNVAAGTAAAPAICAGNDINTGLFAAAADQIGIANNGVESVRINATGQVGIGTTSPGFVLDIASTTTIVTETNYAASAVSPWYYFRKSRGASVGTNTIVQNNDSLGAIWWWGANGTDYTNAALLTAEVDGTPGTTNDMPGRLVFSTTPDGSGTAVERMRISSTGRVGIGRTPLSVLDVLNKESNSINTLTVTSTIAGDVSTHPLVIVKKDNNSTTSQLLVGFLMNGGSNGQGQINANGAGAAAFGAYSDERLKENIVDLPGQLDNILSLRPIEFDYKDGSGHQIGFIAQEVEEIYPDLVNPNSDGYLTLTDLNKNDARLIKAFQELAAKVAALEARVAELEG